MDTTKPEPSEPVAGPVQRPVGRPVPERRPDGMPTSADERYLRRLLARRVGMPQTYYDDGEAQGQEHGIVIDFMREPVADIDAKLRALNVARFEVRRTAMPQGCETPDGCAVHGCRGECLKTPNAELRGRNGCTAAPKRDQDTGR